MRDRILKWFVAYFAERAAAHHPGIDSALWDCENKRLRMLDGFLSDGEKEERNARLSRYGRAVRALRERAGLPAG